MKLKLFAFYIVKDVEKFNFGFVVIYKLWSIIPLKNEGGYVLGRNKLNYLICVSLNMLELGSICIVYNLVSLVTEIFEF